MATEATQTVREAGTGMVEMIRRNPIPAAMVGIGLGWLAMSGRSSQSGSQGRYGYQGRYGQGYGRQGDGSQGGYSGDYQSGTQDRFGDSSRYAQSSGQSYGGSSGGGSDALHQAQQKVGEMADGVSQKVDSMTSQAGQMADELPYRVRSIADDLGQSATEMYRSNPLAIGAIAVAVGTAVGLALPPTEVERRTLAQPARQAFSKAEEVASDTLDQVEQKARDVEQQAREEERQSRPH